jgi:AcrR family transcriptional regulator
MMPSESSFFKKQKYHHGELRSALIEAALEALKTQGMEALSLRTLSKAVGVTQAAPYSHFRDKDDLLAAIAETGFQRLAIKMVEAATGQSGVQPRIVKLISAYIHFAVENRTLFQLMFSRELSVMKNYPTLAMTAGKSYSLFASVLSKRVQPIEDANFMTVMLWSLCHGLTTLFVDEKINLAQFNAADIDSFAKRAVNILSDKLI